MTGAFETDDEAKRDDASTWVVDALAALCRADASSAVDEVLARIARHLEIAGAYVGRQVEGPDGANATIVAHRWPPAADPAAAPPILEPSAEQVAALAAGRRVEVGSMPAPLVAIPIVVDRAPWGHLGLVGIDLARAPMSADTLRTLAGAIGAAVVRAQMIDAARRQAMRIRNLHELTSRRSRDVAGQIRRVLALAVSTLDYESGLVVRPVADAPDVEIVHAYSPDPHRAVGVRTPARATSGLTARVWVEGSHHADLVLSGPGDTPRWHDDDDIEFLRLVADWIGAMTEHQLAESRRTSLERRVERTQRLSSLCVALGGIAHDFNNHLMVTETGLSLADEAVERGDVTLVPHLLHNARQATERAATLTMQLLTFAGRLDLIFTPTDVPALFAEHLPALQAGLQSKVLLEVEDDEALADVAVDKAALLEVLSNLVINASEADPGSVPISVRLSLAEFDVVPSAYFVADGATAGRYCSIEVEDAGRGMPDESLRRVFEPFFSTKFTGRGIGLSEAMGVVRAHRGAIDVDSAPGRGTRVRVLVPLEQSEPRYVPMRRSATHSPRAATHEHLLLVDDVDMLRETLGHALQQRGMQVEGAANGAVGLEMFRADPDRYTAIVLDVTMPVMDGKETLARIRRTHPDVPVILVSGYTEANVAAALSHDDRTLFLQKPFGVTDLLEALRALRGDTAAADD